MEHDIPSFHIDDDNNNLPSIECDYFNPSEVKERLNASNRLFFSMLCLNIRSCRKNLNMLIAFLNTYLLQFSIIILLETWLTEDIDVALSVGGYNSLSIYRNSHGGGIKVFFRNDFCADIIEDLTFVDRIFEVLSFRLSCNGVKYIICCIYRPPSSSIIAFNELFNHRILDKLPLNSDVIIAGDFNINLYNPLNISAINEFTNLMLSYNLFPIINKASIFHPQNTITKFSLIDQIWTNFIKGTDHIAGIINYQISDHLPIFYAFKNDFIRVIKTIKYRLIDDNRIAKFINDCEFLNFDDVYGCFCSDEAFTIFYKKLFKVYESCFPIRKKRIKNNLLSEPWVTPPLKFCIRKKYHMYNLLKRGLISRQHFLRYKRTLTYAIKMIKETYYKNKFIGCGNDSKKIWKNINEISNRKPKKDIREVIKDNVCCKGKDMVDAFNSYFTTVVSGLVNQLPPVNSFNNFLRNITRIDSTCFIYPTNTTEILDIMISLGNKSNAMYDIPPKIILAVKEKVIPCLEYLYNFCINSGKYPSIFKNARITPIFKSGNAYDVSNYRPISNLLTFDKIFEKILYIRLINFAFKNNIIEDVQFGFKQHSSTTLAIFTLVKDLVSSIKLKYYTIAIFIDLKKAFDVVDRNILLKKLSIYGYRGHVWNLLKSFLADRKQFTSIDGFDSVCLENSYGVPQGAVLGPFLFNLFINDICKIPNAKKVLFADDTVLYVSDPSFEVCVQKALSVIDNLSLWLRNNRLVANLNKTKLMLITTRKVELLPDIHFNGTLLEWVDHIRYLGIILDSKLNFNQHVNKVCSDLSKYRGVMYSLSSCLPQSVMMNLYNCLVYPAIVQDIIIWGGVNKTGRNRVKILMNKILRLILNVKFNDNNIPLTRTNDMYKQLRLLKFEDIYKYYLLKFIHFVQYERFDIFINEFSHLLPSNIHSTRSTRINLPNVRTDLEKRFTVFKCCELWRNIPEGFLEPQTQTKLKKNYKDLVLSSY